MSLLIPGDGDLPITHDQAMESAHRLINSHFRQEPHARVGIPARPGYDDDLIICQYIREQKARSEQTQPPKEKGGMMSELDGALAVLRAIQKRRRDNDLGNSEWLEAINMAVAIYLDQQIDELQASRPMPIPTE